MGEEGSGAFCFHWGQILASNYKPQDVICLAWRFQTFFCPQAMLHIRGIEAVGKEHVAHSDNAIIDQSTLENDHMNQQPDLLQGKHVRRCCANPR